MVKQFWKWLFTILEICSFKKGLLGYVSWNRIGTTKKIEIAYSVACLRTLGEILSPFPWAQKSEAALHLLSNPREKFGGTETCGYFSLCFFKPFSWDFFQKLKYNTFCLIRKLKPEYRICTHTHTKMAFGECSERLVAAWPQDRLLACGY